MTYSTRPWVCFKNNNKKMDFEEIYFIQLNTKFNTINITPLGQIFK